MTDRDIWISAARKVFAASSRQPCFVCGRFASITQAHHIVPLSFQYDRGFRIPDNEHVWLCPNHHVMAHLYVMNDDRSMSERAIEARDGTKAALNTDLSEDEFEKMMDLMRRAARGPE